MAETNQTFIKEISEFKEKIRNKVNPEIYELPIDINRIVCEYGVVTGGCISSIYHDEDVHDYDIYLTDQSQIEAIEKLCQEDDEVKDSIKDINTNYMVETKTEGKLHTARAITFENNVQIITFMNSRQTYENFDFIHCLPKYDFLTSKFYISERQFFCIKNKILVKNGLVEPTQERIEKYQKRGWKFL